LTRPDEGLVRLLSVGEFLEGFTLPDSVAFDEWQRVTGEKVRTLRMRAISAVLEESLANGTASSVVDLCECLVGLDGWDEAACRLAMRVEAAAGCWDRAERHYRNCADTIAAELAAEPDPSTVELHRRIRRRDPAMRFPVTDQAVARQNRSVPVPNERDVLFGRETERARIRDLLLSEDATLVTLTGTAGCGKTRLALQVSHEIAQELCDATVFVDLTRVQSAPEVMHAICTAAGIRDRAATDAELLVDLAEQLDDRAGLFVLDNFEHVIEAAGDLAAILSRVRGPRFLVTSREALRIAGEHEVPVPPLRLPVSVSATDTLASPAVQLFLDRARRSGIVIEENAETLRAIREICASLGGLPLALELVVPLLHLHSPEDLAGLLPESLELLNRPRRDAPDRHQSLQAAVDWSYDLLSSIEKRLFAELSLFPNGYDYRAVEAMYCGVFDEGELANGLAALVEKNLLRPGETPDARTLGMLEPIRQYGHARCAIDFPDTEIRRRHAHHYAHRVELIGGDLHGPRQRTTLRELTRMRDNLVAAMGYLHAVGDIERGLKLAIDLTWYWYLISHFRAGRHWLELFLGEAERRGMVRCPRGYFAVGLLNFQLGEWRKAAWHFRESIRLGENQDDQVTKALALAYLGVSERWLGESSQGWLHQEEALSIARSLDEPEPLRIALIAAYCTSGGVFAGEPPTAELEECLDLATAQEDEWSIAHSHNGLGDLYCELGDQERARREYVQSAREFAQLGDTYMEAWNYEGLGRVALREGDLQEALRWTGEALKLSDQIGDELNCALLLARMALLMDEMESETPAASELAGARLAGAALTVISRIREEEVRGAPQVTEALDTVRQIQQRNPGAFDAGRSLTRAAAVALATSLPGCAEG
jgi:predicted ATPase